MRLSESVIGLNKIMLELHGCFLGERRQENRKCPSGALVPDSEEDHLIFL